MQTFRDIVTAVVYCYITTKFHYTKRDSGLLAFGGVMLQRFEFTKVCMEKTLTAILAEIMIVIAFRVSSPKTRLKGYGSR